MLLPAAASLADAQATAQRIGAAGFGDYFIVREGNEANSIALGRYRNEDSANRRAQSLVAAGFPARAEPLGDGRVSYWIDLVPGNVFDTARAQAAVQVAAAPARLHAPAMNEREARRSSRQARMRALPA